MKKLLSVLTAFLACAATAGAVEILDVEPGDGTLNDAINQYKGERIYRLQNGYNGYYTLSETINNTGFDLTIIGGGQADADDPKPDMPPTVQTSGPSGTVFAHMFDAYDDLTLRDIYFCNASADGIFNTEFFIYVGGNDVTVTVDGCTVDPSGNPIYVMGARPEIYITNSLFNRLTNQTTSVNGPVNFLFQNNEAGPEVLYLENNTLIGLSTSIFSDNCNPVKSGLTWINHNTFIHHKSQIDWMANQENFYFTNNLLYDCHVIPYDKTWIGGWDNYEVGNVSELLWSAPDEMVKDNGVDIEWGYDKMTSFVAYNIEFKNQEFFDNLDELYEWTASKGAACNMYFMPLVWDEDAPCHGIDLETALANNPQYKIYNSAEYPNWRQGSNRYDIDPTFNDSRIKEKSMILAQWVLPAVKKDYYTAYNDGDDSFTQLDWYWDPDGDMGKNEAWPLFDGSYTNEEAMSFGIDGLPAGDLNWFPEKKAIWEANKDDIEAHIKALNLERMELGSVENVTSTDLQVSFYPNPASDIINIALDAMAENDARIEIYSTVGQLVKAMNAGNGDVVARIDISDLAAGTYIYKVNCAGTAHSGIFIKK